MSSWSKRSSTARSPPGSASARRSWAAPLVCRGSQSATRCNCSSSRSWSKKTAAAGLALRPDAPVLAFIQADVAFHTALYRLSGNRAIEDTVAAQWPHLKRSMGAVLDDPEQRPLVWAEHREILRLVLDGDAAGAERAARRHTDRAGGETARRLSQSSFSMGGNRDAADGAG